MSQSKRKLVIATKSSARLVVLNMLGIDYLALEPKVKEEYGGLGPRDTVLNNASKKAMSIVAFAPENSIIIGFDTIIIDKSYRIIAKPMTLKFHATVLRDLSGAWHKVVTGSYIIDLKDNMTDSFVEETKVKFKELTDKEIKLYLSSMEGLGKAGGYAIQGIASMLIEKIDGDYFNAVGLPVHKLYITLRKHGYDMLMERVKKRILKTGKSK